MTKDEFIKRRDAIYSTYKNNLKSLDIEYIKQNAKFKIGNIIERYGEIIKIESISYSKWGDYPCPLYKGHQLKKDLTPRKDNNILFLSEEGSILIK